MPRAGMMAQDERHPLINKTLNALYPPGSTFKPAVAMALMEAGVDPEEQVVCGGGYTLGPVVSQSYGTIPDPAWKQRRYRQEWTQSDTLNAAIGQGYVILNPLQLAVMAARVASGRDVQPRLVMGGHPPPAPLPFAARSFEAVRSGMTEVVNGQGTAGRSRLPFPDIQMAGKTGTAQVRNIGADRGRAGAAWRYRDHGLFIFFAPVAAPRYAGAVVIEHGLGGARAAAPVACDVMTYLFDKDRAMAALQPLEQQWGGSIAERMARRTEQWQARVPGAPPPAEAV
jgi:penicillin-binding protein 2